MSQYAWILELRPGYEDEYTKRHDEIWPELVAETKDAGVRNYSIFRHGLSLIGYFETDDLELAIKRMNEGEATRRWDKFMAPIMKVEIDEATNFPFLLPMVCRMQD